MVEDAAQAVYAKYKDRWLGTIGHMGCYSFHETKNYSCGEGGALLINAGDDDLIERAEIAREKGTNRSKFFRGQVDKYSWVGPGSSYLPSDMLAAFLMAQFEEMDTINNLRKHVFERYWNELLPLAEKGLFALPNIPEYNTINYHMFYLMFNTGRRTRPDDGLSPKQKRHQCRLPLPAAAYVPNGRVNGLSCGRSAQDRTRQRYTAPTPRLYAGMDDEDIAFVIQKVKAFYQ